MAKEQIQGMGGNMANLMKQAQKMQKEMRESYKKSLKTEGGSFCRRERGQLLLWQQAEKEVRVITIKA